MSSNAGAVEARGVGIHYPSDRVGLHPSELDVQRGEVVVLLGPNGSGKSTCLRLLATDLRSTEGTLTLLGRPVDRGSLRDLRRRIGFCADTPVHLSRLSGEENARFFSELRGPIDGELETRLSRLFEAFELGEVRRVPVAEYSFGMRRKLLLLETLAPRLPLLLLDEPTVGLDPSGIRVLRQEILACAADGSAVVIGSNDVRELPLWADRIVFLHRGRIVEDAPSDVLLRRLEGRTRIEIALSTAGPAGVPDGTELLRIPGVAEVQRGPGGIVIQSSCGGEPLPTLLEVLLARGERVRDVRVREPDLGDVFRRITGEGLDSGALPLEVPGRAE